MAPGDGASRAPRELVRWLHRCLNLVGGMGQGFLEVDQLAVGVDIDDVFDADANTLFRDIDSRFDGEDAAGKKWLGVVVGVVDADADRVSEAMNEVFAKWLAVQVF